MSNQVDPRCGHCCDHDGAMCVTGVPVFADLGHDEQAMVQTLVRSREHEAGEILHWAGDTPEHLAVVNSGLVKGYRITSAGKEQIVQLLGPGDFFGELALFAEQPLQVTYEAVQDSRVCYLHRGELARLVMDQPSIALKFLQELSQRVATAQTVIELIGLHSVQERLAYLLVELTRAAGKQTSAGWVLELDLTRRELASYLGTTTETVSRRIHTFAERGLIELRSARTIIVPDLEALEAETNTAS